MAGGLPKQSSDFHRLPNARIAIIASMWHAQCVDKMIDRARRELLAIDVKAENIKVHRVPGSLELPFAARVLFDAEPRLDAIIAFGVILKGATGHDETVMQQVVHGFGLVSDRFGKPIVNEVIGVADISDAVERSDDTDRNKGLEAVFALSEILHWVELVKRSSAPCGASFGFGGGKS
jgi:6,7-dimethyl-8-ribityllumazine synthase